MESNRSWNEATVYWSAGWTLLNLGNASAALAVWQRAEDLHGGRPFWVPYSKAVALMGQGETEAALAWWSVAQSSLAPHLDTSAQALRHFKYWRPKERELLAALLDAQQRRGHVPPR